MKFTMSSVTILSFWSLKSVQVFDTVVPFLGTNPNVTIKCEVKDLYIVTTASIHRKSSEYPTVKERLNKFMVQQSNGILYND